MTKSITAGSDTLPSQAAASNDESDGKPRITQLYKFTRALLYSIFTLGFDYKMYGLRNVPLTGGVILVANHESFLDPPLVATGLHRPISFFAKSELFTNRWFGWFIRGLNAFPVRQGAADIAAMKEAIHRLKNGHALIVFPEGSRSEDGQFQALEAGVGLMIRRARVPVVPVAVDGAYQTWPKGEKMFRFYPLRVSFGLPIKLDHLKPDQIIVELDKTMRKLLADLRSEPHPAQRVRDERWRRKIAERDNAPGVIPGPAMPASTSQGK